MDDKTVKKNTIQTININEWSAVHQQNGLYSLAASRSVWEDVECKLRCVNFRRVSDPRRAFQPAFRVSGISENWYSSTIGVIIIGLQIPRSAGDNFGCTWEHRQQAWERWRHSCEHLATPAISLGTPTTSLGVPATSMEAPRITVE